MNLRDVSNPNDLWIFHREEIETIQDGVCEVYVLLDAVSRFCFGFLTSKDSPTSAQLTQFINDSIHKYQASPRAIAILKTDPVSKVVGLICQDLKIPFIPIVNEFSRA